MTKDNYSENFKYKLTIGNLSSIASIIFAIYYFAFPGIEGWGIYISILLIFFAIFIFTIDFLIQKFRMKYILINLTEILIIVTIYYIIN